MKKYLLMFLAGLGAIALVGCGGSSGGSTVLTGVVSGASGTTSDVSLKASMTEESFEETGDVEDGQSFRFTGVPEGVVEVELTRTGETGSMKFDVDVDSGTTTELDVFLMTWTPEAVGEFRSRSGSDSFGDMRPMGPTGTSMSVLTSGDRRYETPNGLVVMHKADGSVEVDDTGYTAP